MSIKRGAIYWITRNPHRGTTGSVQKPGRPGIVVSNDTNNSCSLTLEVVYLTGKQKKEIPTHCTITSTGVPSTALCEQITTVSTEQIREYIGTCTKEEMAAIDRCLAISLGLKEPTESEPITGETDARITGLERDLAEAQVREAMLQKMYNDLLTRSLAK